MEKKSENKSIKAQKTRRKHGECKNMESGYMGGPGKKSEIEV